MALRPMHWVYVGSFAFHAVGALVLNAVKTPPPPDVQIVEMQTFEQPKKEKPKPPEPKPEPAVAKAPPRPAAAPPPEAAPEAPPPAPDFGFAMGSADSAGGIAVGAPVKAAEPVRQTVKKLTAKAPEPESGCTEAEVKAKATNMPRPAYTDEARAAGIEGKVRVELHLDAAGQVVDAKVIEGLGNGLDENAVAALKGASFTPATRCGVPSPSTFTVAVRFTL